jgi:uncharacterized protein YbjT (DUF2867 family)
MTASERRSPALRWEMPGRHVFRPNRDFTARAAGLKVAAMPSPPFALVIAGGSHGTGRVLAERAWAAGYEVRVIDDPECSPSLRAAVATAGAVAIIPARAVGSLRAQVWAVLVAASAAAVAPHLIVVTGFSLGYGMTHALNTPERLRDRREAEDLARRSGLPYTIVRPTWLTSDPPGGYAITLTQDPWPDGMIARTDLADVCLAAIAEPAARNKTFAVFAEPDHGRVPWPRQFADLEPDATA